MSNVYFGSTVSKHASGIALQQVGALPELRALTRLICTCDRMAERACAAAAASGSTAETDAAAAVPVGAGSGAVATGNGCGSGGAGSSPSSISAAVTYTRTGRLVWQHPVDAQRTNCSARRGSPSRGGTPRGKGGGLFCMNISTR